MSRFAARLTHTHASCKLINRAMSIEAENGWYSNLEQVGNVFAFFLHGLGAAEGGIGGHMDPLLLAPVYGPVIAPVTVHLHLDTTRPCTYADALLAGCGKICM